MILGVDTGGTFTDFALLQKDETNHFSLSTHKVLSSPEAPEIAILQGIKEMGLEQAAADGQLRIIHGSTVATNAALEGKGVKTAFITNRGFADLLTIGRQTRPQLYQLQTPPIAPPVPAELCLECSGRITAGGKVLESIDENDLNSLIVQLKALKPEAIAINQLFSFLDSSHEEYIEQALQQALDWRPFISRSSYVLPEYREYERGIATWLNASLGPLVQGYLLRLKAGCAPAPLAIMQSSGGTIDAEQAAQKSVNLLLSGPAGGLAAASYLAEMLDEPRLMTFDMGGTSTDVALIDGKVNITNEGRIGPYPVAVPMVDMHTIGAGGGSLAYVDTGNLLQVGPQSAGASPGPACYGLGGTQATVTDANLILGRLLPEAFQNATIKLDTQAAETAVTSISEKLVLTSKEAAEGIVVLANEHMAQALRVISVARGYDPREFRLCCFGGAGGLHVCALADALEMTRAMVPYNSGVLSAFGMLVAPAQRQFSRTHQKLIEELDVEIETLNEELNAMIEQGRAELLAEHIAESDIRCVITADLRYQGQSATLNIPWTTPAEAYTLFQQSHEERYGHCLPTPVELVNIRVAIQSIAKHPMLSQLNNTEEASAYTLVSLFGIKQQVPVYHRHQLASGQTLPGPALITETNSTTFIAIDWLCSTDNYGNLLLERLRT